MPGFLRSRERLFDDVETLIVPSMHERKTIMYDQSDAFVVAPGGVGTLEEVIEVLSWKRLDLHSKPVIFLNLNGFWEPLLAALAGSPPAGKGRLYWFVIDHQELPADPGPHIRTDRLDGDDADAVDYRQLLALPVLGEISAAQVRLWLKELKATAGVSLSDDRRREIAGRVTQPDGKPVNVYDRLTREGFWASAN